MIIFEIRSRNSVQKFKWSIGRCRQHLVELEVLKKGLIWRLDNSDQGVAKEELARGQ